MEDCAPPADAKLVNVRVAIFAAEGLAVGDLLVQSSDPYVRVTIISLRSNSSKNTPTPSSGGDALGSKKTPEKRFEKRTKTIKNTLNPVWSEKLDLGAVPASQVAHGHLVLNVFDEDAGSQDELLGQASVELPKLPRDGTPTTFQLPLHNVRRRRRQPQHAGAANSSRNRRLRGGGGGVGGGGGGVDDDDDEEGSSIRRADTEVKARGKIAFAVVIREADAGVGGTEDTAAEARRRSVMPL